MLFKIVLLIISICLLSIVFYNSLNTSHMYTILPYLNIIPTFQSVDNFSNRSNDNCNLKYMYTNGNSIVEALGGLF